MMPDWTWLIAAFVAGEFLGFITAAILAAGRRADENEAMDNEPPRGMPKIWDGYDYERH